MFLNQPFYDNDDKKFVAKGSNLLVSPLDMQRYNFTLIRLGLIDVMGSRRKTHIV